MPCIPSGSYLGRDRSKPSLLLHWFGWGHMPRTVVKQGKRS
jgi:hypothetical protein